MSDHTMSSITNININAILQAEEAPSDDESYKADTITEWLDDVNSILSDHTSGPEDIEMASMAVTANSTSVYQRVKNEGSEGEGGKKVSPNCSVPGYLEQSLIREKKK
ncbi:hypothetical protein EON65_53650 [archaeon]|nr:MAG: hypothetical protein EON65_53650 [archaeon]